MNPALPPQPAPDPALLQAHGLTKTFPGVRALDCVDFTLRAGEIHALLGENGAGKSTLIKLLTGVFPRDAGEIRLAGRPIAPRSPLHAQSLGISTVYQEVNLIPYLSVAENISLGREPTLLRAIRWGRVHARARDALRRLGLTIDVGRPLNSYSIAIQQMVAIARAVDVRARVLILDEPTSSLDAHEVEQLYAVMRRLKADGLGILFITHFLEQVYAISDRITVLRNGRLVGTYDTAALPRLELVAHMIGKDLGAAAQHAEHAPPACAATPAPPLLAARDLGRHGAVQNLNLELPRGEILGLAGLLGSGRTEAARLLFGIDRPDHGHLELDGRRVAWRSPRNAIARGLGFCPEDRKTAGLVPTLSVRENLVLALQARRGWLRRLSGRAQRELAARYIEMLNIATADAERPVAQLSGGNQQKVILARWLAAQPRLLIVDEPTRGIDVGAKAEIERLIGRLCADGLAVVFISSELDEVVRNCHRVVVLRDRTQVGELTGARIQLQEILRLIAATQAA